MSSDIRHIVISRKSDLIAVAAFEKTVAIWDINRETKVSQFDTILDYGGRRLLLGDDGTLCITASYSKGLNCYNSYTGDLLWTIPKIKKIQSIMLIAEGQSIFCDVDSKRCFIVSADGKNVNPVSKRISAIYENQYDGTKLLVSNKLIIQDSSGVMIASIQKESFGIIAVAFAPGILCISESGASLRCFDTANGREMWRYVPQSGTHVMEIVFKQGHRLMCALEWSYESGGDFRIIEFQSATGEFRLVSRVGLCAQAKFSNNGSRLLTSTGLLIDTNTGIVRGKLDF
jgi:WD40 repeat protein